MKSKPLSNTLSRFIEMLNFLVKDHFYFKILTLPLIASVVMVEIFKENGRGDLLFLDGLFLEENRPKFPSKPLENSQNHFISCLWLA